jgi:hypothetical protein
MFHWLRDHRRAEALERPFPPEWEAFLRANVSHYSMLDEAESAELRTMVQVFLDEKHWEGCGGLELTDEIRVTIAAQACLLLLALPHEEYYRNVESILVYPSTVVSPECKPPVSSIAWMAWWRPQSLSLARLSSKVRWSLFGMLSSTVHVIQSKGITWSITSLPTNLTC